MTRRGSAGLFIGLLLMVSVLIGGAKAATYTVGDDVGWVLPGAANKNFSYTLWAAQQTFVVGDVLQFRYKANVHNVQPLPNKESFAACDISAAVVNAFETGSTNIPLKYPGTKWYVCGVGQHCQQGMKFKIDVMARAVAIGTAAAPSGVTADTGAASGSAIGQGSGLAIVATALLLAFIL